MREKAFIKARRLLAEGRVLVRQAGPDYLIARVRGDSARLYRTGYQGGRWHCDCDAKSTCGHVLALALKLLWLEREGRGVGPSDPRDRGMTAEASSAQ
jgi:hypothetical protein